MCPREGKECNEYMCGNMIDGICGGKPKESDYDRGYKKGRADAFDEFLTLAKNGISLGDIERQLKENKNG